MKTVPVPPAFAGTIKPGDAINLPGQRRYVITEVRDGYAVCRPARRWPLAFAFVASVVAGYALATIAWSFA